MKRFLAKQAQKKGPSQLGPKHLQIKRKAFLTISKEQCKQQEQAGKFSFSAP
jgi:hypothetical protein